RAHPSRRRHGGAALPPCPARLAVAMRGGPRTGAVGSAGADREQEFGLELDRLARGLSRHLQPRLLHHQARPVDSRRADARAGRARHRATARGDRSVTAWSGLGLLLLVAAGIVLTGLPAFVVLIAAASLGALA